MKNSHFEMTNKKAELNSSNIVRKAIIIVMWIVLWEVLSCAVHNDILLVGPLQVMGAFLKNATTFSFWQTIVFSLLRIGAGFFVALLLGILLGAIASRLQPVKEFFAPLMTTLKAIPVASFVVLLLIWFGADRISFFISFLIVFPNVYIHTIAGIESTDWKLLEMAQVFRVSGIRKWFYLYRPAMTPYLYSCLQISLGMAWKSGVAAEVIGMTSLSIGERLYMSKIYLDTAQLFAWTLTVILMSYLFEKIVLTGIQKMGEWKPYPNGILLNSERNVSQIEQKADWKLEIDHVSKQYGETPVLQDVCFSVSKGERYLLMAPSGTGKTTLLRIIAGLETPNRGQVRFDFVQKSENDSVKQFDISMVFQEDRLCEEYNTILNIMLTNHGVDRDTVQLEIDNLLPQNAVEKPVKELSGGMKRRVALVRAMLSRSEVVLLDEPFAGLDDENRVRCAKYIMEHLHGRTLICATHNEEDARLLDAKIRRLG